MDISSADRRPLVSIALATYNGDRFLRELLESIYCQSYCNIEVIAGDDCSTDDTASILEEYRESHGLHYQVNGQNLGFLRNFEKILPLCRGEFIALADQDDIWTPEKLEKMVNAIGDASLVYTDAYLVNENGQELPGSLIKNSGVRTVNGRDFRYFVCNTCVTGCTVLFRRDLLQHALPIPICENYHDWWLAVVAACLGGVRYLDEQLVRYRQHGANDTGASVKSPLLSRLGAHLRGEITGVKLDYYRLLKDRALCYPSLSDRLQLDEEELVFLHDIRCYAEGLLDPGFRIAPFILAARHRGTLFPAAGPLEKFVFVFSKLVCKLFSNGKHHDDE
jgi:glycosyltransferase involved in cell wall biosynthesis